MATLAIRLDFAAALVGDVQRSRRVAEILMHPCFRDLERVSAHRGDRWVQHTPKSADAITSILQDAKNSAVAFDTRREKELAAGGEIKNGTREITEGATRFYGDLAFPVPGDLDTTIGALCQLADALDT